MSEFNFDDETCIEVLLGHIDSRDECVDVLDRLEDVFRTSVKDFLRDRILELEKDQEKLGKKINKMAATDPKLIGQLIEMQKIQYTINQLYSCIGRM